MHELITEIEKSIGLPPNWKSYPTIYKKFEWIDEVEGLLPLEEQISSLKERVEESDWEIQELEIEVLKLKRILDQNEIAHD